MTCTIFDSSRGTWEERDVPGMESVFPNGRSRTKEGQRLQAFSRERMGRYMQLSRRLLVFPVEIRMFVCRTWFSLMVVSIDWSKNDNAKEI